MFPNNFSCSDTYNVSGHTYAVEQEDGGIPENLGINFCIWLVIFLTFCMIRRWAWDYGRIALVQSEAKGWTKIFFGTTDASDDQSINESEKTLHIQTEDVSDKGFFSWIAVVFKLSDDDLKHRAGHDAIHYLNFQKCLIYYTVIICVLSIVVILPVNHSGDNIPRRNHYGTTTIANLAPDSNVIWLHTIFAFLYLAILIVMLWKFSQGYETDHDPVSQLTILVSHVSQSASTDQLKQHFEEVYGEGSVSNVQLAYDICQLVVISRKLEAASLGKKTYVMNAMRGGGNQETVVSTNKVCPCCPCWKVKYNGLEYFVKEEEKYKNEFLREKEAVLGSESLGIVFVTFDKPNIVLRCIQDYSLILGGRYIESSMSLALKSSVWSVERAPSPGNIIWENLSADPKYWWIRTAFINVVLFVFVLFVSTPAILLTGWNQLQASIENKADSRGNPFLNQFLPTLMLWTFTAILPAIVSWSSYYEYQWTRTRQEKSVMFKVYIFLLFMIVILPSLALTSLDAFFEMTFKGDFQSFQSRLKCVFLPDSGAFFVNYVITSALIGTALELLRFPELFVYGIRMCYAKTEGEKLLVKQEAVVEFPFGIQYAWMIAIYSIIIIYSIACPLVVPFGLLYLLLKHFVDRYNLFFNYRPPAFKYMDRSVHNIAMYFLIVSTFLLLFCIFFYSIIRLGIRDPQTIFALVVFLITLTLFIGKVCFGWFASYSIYRSSPSRDGQEEVIPDGQIPEAYLPPVLRSSYRVGDLSDDEQANILRRRHYGIQDHVIDSANLRQSDDVIVDVPFEELNTAESK